MPKYWKIIQIVIAAGTLYVFLRPYGNKLGLYSLLALIPIAAVTAVNYVVVKRAEITRWYLALPVLFLAGYFVALASISSGVVKILASATVAFLFYTYEMRFPLRHTIFLEELFALAAGFAWLVGVLAAGFYFNVPWWISSGVIFVAFFLIFAQQFYKMKRGDNRELFYAAAAGLLVFEFYWAALFWPLHFFTTAVVVFGTFYAMYMICNLSFARQLTRRKAYFQIVITLAIVASGLLSSAWQP